MVGQGDSSASSSRMMSRRRFAALAAATAAGVLAACGGSPAPTATTGPTAAAASSAAQSAPTLAPPPQKVQEPTAAATPTKFNEAPMLADMVKAGQLPPVEQRLPPAPLVVTPNKVVGKYGGTFFGEAQAPETTSDFQVAMVTGLFRYSDDLLQLYPEVATGYEFSSDNKSCTIKLRPGIKWSDGQPFTADDVLFYLEDWQFNKDLAPTVAGQYTAGGKPMVVTKVDDYTVKFDFAVPNPAFSLIHYSGGPSEPWRAKHYLQKFHIKYNPNAETDAKAAGFNNWQTRFTTIAGVNGIHYGVQDPSNPVLAPWKPVSNDSQRQLYERNPYYFKVDTAGNQLPYVDKVQVDYASNADVVNLKAVSGQLSAAGLDLQLANFPVLKNGEKAGGYTVTTVYSERGADVAIALNQNHPDPVMKKIFNDVRFRQALSLAINRSEINELIFLGQGVLRQATINESASFFKKEWAESFAQFDLAQANKLFDAVGLDKKAADGTRLRPDGKPMTFQLEYLPQEGPKKEVCELVVKHWAQAGMTVAAAARERNFLLTRINAGQQDATGWHVDRQLERAAYAYGAVGSKLGPGGNSIITYCKAWLDWFASGGKSGVEPPEDAKQLHAAFDAWQQTSTGTTEYTQAAIKVHDLIAQTPYVIGVVGEAPTPVIVRNNIENVFIKDPAKKIWWGAANWYWHPHHPEQWFFTS